MKLALRIAATALVAAGAVVTIEVATPVVVASVPPPPAASPALPTSPRRASPSLSAAALGSVNGLAAPPVAVIAAPAPSVATPDADATPTWVHPSWFPAALDLDTVAAMDGEGVFAHGPDLRSRSVFVYDIDAGQVLFEKNADVVRPVASLTKMVSALTLMSVDPDLDTQLCVGAAQYPTRSGARSHLSTGDCMAGWDVLGAALVASDNRGAYSLVAIAGLDMDAFVARMDEVSADLGMDHSSWSDPSGLEDENLSTARDIARATVAVASHPVLSVVATAPYWDLHRTNRDDVRRVFSTDHLLGRDDIDVLAAKTGYTDTARYCFSTVVQTQDGRRLAITLLGSEGKLSRWADMDRILRWAQEQGAAPAPT